MEYRELIRKLSVPPGLRVPERLTYEDLVARAISRADLREDVRGINASLDLIRRTRGGPWPTEEVTEEFDFVDLVWHEAEFREGGSYAYAVYDIRDQYLGCCYMYPMGRRTQLTEQLLKYDVDVSWWVTPPAYEEGYYTKLYRALRQWIAGELAFKAPYYSNREIPAG
jgi:Acetyltransferase (GNAT) domain